MITQEPYNLKNVPLLEIFAEHMAQEPFLAEPTIKGHTVTTKNRSVLCIWMYKIYCIIYVERA